MSIEIVADPLKLLQEVLLDVEPETVGKTRLSETVKEELASHKLELSVIVTS